MQINKFIFTLIIICFQFSYSQETSFDPYRDLQSAVNLQLGSGENPDLTNIKGSPFLNDDFVKGYIYDSNKDIKSELFLRYDVFNDIFEILLGRNTTSIKKLKRSTNFEYFLNDEKFVLIQAPSVINKNQYVTSNGYVAEIKKINEDLILFKRYMKEYKPPIEAKTMYDTDKAAYIKNDEYYIIKIDGKYEELELNRRKILDAFPDKYQKELKRFLKTNGIKFRGDDEEIEKEILDLLEHFQFLKN